MAMVAATGAGDVGGDDQDAADLAWGIDDTWARHAWRFAPTGDGKGSGEGHARVVLTDPSRAAAEALRTMTQGRRFKPLTRQPSHGGHSCSWAVAAFLAALARSMSASTASAWS